MIKVKIGIDIDGVITDEDAFLLDYGIKFCFEKNLNCFVNLNNYESKKFVWDYNTLKGFRESYYDIYVNDEKPRRFASEIIRKLKDDGHSIYIITSRHLSTSNSVDGKEMRDKVKYWLDKNDIVYDDIYFSNDKIVQIKDLNLDIMIEDSPVTIPSFSEFVHIFCFDCRYNRDLDCYNMTRVFSWYDIYLKIKYMIGSK